MGNRTGSLCLVMVLLFSSIAGCFGDEPKSTEEKKTEVDDDETTGVADLPPSLVLWNSSKVWDGTQPTVQGAAFDEDLNNLTISYRLLDSEDFSVVSGPFFAMIDDDGTFSIDVPIVNPGVWLISVTATDDEYNEVSATANIEILAPDEPAATVSFIWVKPSENSTVGTILGNVNHAFIETCLVGYDPMGTATIILAEMNFSTGAIEIDIDTEEVLLEGEIRAECGRFSSTSTIINVVLEIDEETEPETDSDGDGIIDEDDECASTPDDEPVYSDGCSDSQRDSDNDGIPDSDDMCPNTPTGETPDGNGCSDSQKDSDGDGVDDAQDQCPSTTSGAVVDSVGCEMISWEPQDSWLCQDGQGPWVKDYNSENGYSSNNNGADSAGGGGSGPWFQCSVSVSTQNDEMVVDANGIPNHDFLSTRGCCADEVELEWHITLNPVNDTTGGHDSTNCPASQGQWECAPDRGAVAVAVNGVPMYGPEEGPGGDAVALHFDYFDEDRQPIFLGWCTSHSAGDNFHYHYDAQCQFWEAATGEDMSDYEIEKLEDEYHSPIIGWAFDGFPIYGMYGYDDDGSIRAITSSYAIERTQDGGDQGYNGIDDWNYVDGLGDLDECNGRFGPTPEYPEGIYHYVSTPLSGSPLLVTDTNNDQVSMIGFPYFLMCYHGIADVDSQPSSGQGGPGPPPGIVYASGTLYEFQPELIEERNIFNIQSSDGSEQWLNISGILLALVILMAFSRRRGQASA